MSLSSFTVCMNALRLNLFDLHDASKDRPLKKRALPDSEEPQRITEERILPVKGMMCEHCEATVEKALQNLDGITEAKADHTKNEEKITFSHPLDETILIKTIEDAGYEVEIQQEKKEEETKMEKILHVEGMMCEHCEANVKKALEAIDGVESALADHNANTAKVVLSKDVANEVLKQAVEAKDYKVTGIEG